MGFEVLITDEAFADLDSIASFIRAHASIDVARKWFAAIVSAIETLEEMPSRCPLAPEAGELGEDVRLLLHGPKNRAYKIYFKIQQPGSSRASVKVFHVRHWARKPLTDEEIEEFNG
jgi:plasmid stabilization system protein ParE